MYFRPKNKRCGGFTGLFATELAVLSVLYALYFTAVLAVARRLAYLSDISKPLVIFAPIALSFVVSACWYAFRRHSGVPKGELSIPATAHFLIFVFTFLSAILATLLWLTSPSKA